MKTLYLLALLSAAFFGSAAQAQRAEKMDFHLRHHLAQPHPAGEFVDLFIHGEREAIGVAVRAHGGFVKMALPRLVSARVPVANVKDLSNEQAVHHFEFSMDKGELMNDSMRVKNRVDQVQQGAYPLVQGYDGTGVVVGIIDSGLDMTHPDFRDANDGSRVYRYWDQVPAPNAQSPEPFGYGTEWTQEQINAGQSTAVEPPSLNGHGTTVAGTAVGNGLANGRHKGVASGADIIIVGTNFGLANWRASVADAVAYIIREAEAVGKPAVINASLGSYSGSHDGKDAAALFIEELLNEQGGRVMACAAGNANSQFPFHMRTEVGADTTFTWFTTNQNGPQYNIFNYPNLYFEIWADAEDFANVQFAIGADRVLPTLAYRGRTAFRSIAGNAGTVFTEPLVSSSGNALGTVQYYAEQRGEQILLQVLMASPDSLDYMWRFMTTGSGVFDVWTLTTVTSTSNIIGPVLAAPLGLPFPTAAEYPAMANYVEPDNRKHIVDSWTCLPNVITVGNYCNEVAYIDYAGNPQTVPGVEQDIALNSSAGPTRDERVKPDIASTGDITFTAGPLEGIQAIIDLQNGWKVDPGGMHVRNGGTSMASPVVAGVAALYLQKCPDATAMEVLQAMQANARTDEFTGAVPNNRWGMGKLDAFATVVHKAALTADPTEFCEGDSLTVEVPEGFSDVEWSNGSTADPLELTEAGDLSAILHTPSGCMAYTDTIIFVTLPPPPVPTIDVDGSTLTSSVGPAYQWYWNGSALEGALEQVLDAPLAGVYRVEVIGANGCSSFSAEAGVIILALSEGHEQAFVVWPSPAHDRIHLQLPVGATGATVLTVIASDGRVVRAERATAGSPMNLSLTGLAAGTYMLQAQMGEERWSQRFVKMP